MNLKWLQENFSNLSEIKPLDKGGQKFVFEAVHSEHEDVVLKLLNHGSNPERIEREVLAGEIISCNRVPKIYEKDIINDDMVSYQWIIEQRIFGVNLRKDLEEGGAFSKEKLFKMIDHLMEALLLAEKNRVVHRDIKPENVMIDNNDDFWLLDFGLARHLDMSSLTETKFARGVGTYGYSPPEQMKNQKRQIDSRTDLFALGVLIYECATGVNPFHENAANFNEVFDRVEKMSISDPELDYDTNKSLWGFISTLTQKFPSQRPDSVEDAYEWFEEIKQEME